MSQRCYKYWQEFWRNIIKISSLSLSIFLFAILYLICIYKEKFKCQKGKTINKYLGLFLLRGTDVTKLTEHVKVECK